MNVFVLCVGRCGSVTFTEACSHIENYTASHESRCSELGEQRLSYPLNHIEVDNRLAWFLGRLDEKYGDSAIYVHLRRKQEDMAESYNKRWANDLGIMSAYAKGVLKSRRVGLNVAADMVQTVTENIEHFLRDKSQVFTVDIENPEQEFSRLWEYIGAEGDLQKALNEFSVKHNLNVFVTSADSSFGTEEDFVVKQFEEKQSLLSQKNKELQQEVRKLKAECLQIQSELSGIEEVKQTSSEKISELQTQLYRLRSSVSYRVGSTITRNLKTPKGWLRLPLDMLKIVAGRYKHGSNSASKSKNPQRINNVIWTASQIATKESWGNALAFAEKNADGCEKRALHVLRANLAETDAHWLQELNAYLHQNNAGCSVTLKEGGEPRFYRLSSIVESYDNSGPLISVIMPAFNAEDTLRLASSSILGQTHSNLELIIVDDCSSDSTYSIACELAASDRRVKVLRNAVNVGPYVSKNLALRIAKGKFITGHDADDWALPNRLSRDLAILLDSNGKIKSLTSSMLRMTKSGHMLFFTKIGSMSSDGANRVSSISLLIESDTLRSIFGGWDSVRFGADSELIERIRHYFKDAFIQLDHVGMLCLDHDMSLTNHSAHGVDRVSGVSPVRQAYRASWQRWHHSLQVGCYRVDFPMSTRPYEVPSVMRVSADDIDACIGQNCPIEVDK